MSEETRHSGDPYQTVAQMVPGQIMMRRYALKKILGRGGFGVVWLARDTELDMDVAIKFLSDVIVSNPEAIDDLKRETRFSLKLTHPNIVRIYGFIQGSSLAGISMEYIDGGTLSALKVQRPERCFDADVLAPVVEKLCDALEYAHRRVRIAHRDLKPGNLMVDSEGELKVADFGISRSISDTHTALTRAAASGTPAFMSPQQMMGEPTRATDDIYSLGATLYDLLAGKPPFYSGDVATQVREARPQPIAERRAELGIEAPPVPEVWEEVVLACLEKDPQARPKSAAEVAKRLGLHVSRHASDAAVVLGSSGPGDDPGTPPESRLHTPTGGSGTAPDPTAPSLSGVAGPAAGNPLSEPSVRSDPGTARTAGAHSGPAPAPSTVGPGAAAGGGRRKWFLPAVLVVVVAAAFGGWRMMTAGEGAGPNSTPAVSSAAGGALNGADRGAPSEAGGAEVLADGTGSPGGSEPEGNRPAAVDGSEGNGRDDGGALPDAPGGGGGNGTEDLSDREAEVRAALGEGDTARAEAALNALRAAEPGSSRLRSFEDDLGRLRTIDRARAEVRRAVADARWTDAERGLAGLAELNPSDTAIGGFRASIDKGLAIQTLHAEIPRAIAAGSWETAARKNAELRRLRPGDDQAAAWQRQIDAALQRASAAESDTKATNSPESVKDPAKPASDPPPVNTASADEAAIGKVLVAYRSTLESVDFDRFRALWVAMDKKKREQFERAFREVQSQSIEWTSPPQIELDGDRARAWLREKRAMQMRVGSSFEREFETELSLERTPEGWKIADLEAR